MTKIFESGYEKFKPKIIYTPGPDWTFESFSMVVARGRAGEPYWKSMEQMCEFTPDPEEGIKSPFITSSFTVLCENVYKSREEAIQGLIEQLRNRRVTLQNSINSVVKRIEGLDVELHEIRYEAKYG